MAKAYIANRPVRFDRNYKVGEVIPDRVIFSRMGQRLMEMGRILCVDLPAPPSTEPPQEGAQPPAGGGNNVREVTPGAAADAPEGESGGAGDGLTATDLMDGTGGEFVCDVCGRMFQSQQGLAAHSRSHKE